ncbi:MAG: alcohol dehydrogenase catalytic domain-containing protein [Desulfarculaceae bacterium]|nr:alcohol dehydrogenase catalytic domain-containing protein [Desulfarculaceae bacterium]
MPDSLPETSLVIRTFNEERHLGPLLESLAGQAYRDFEVIVVDSGSFDRTREIARAHGANLVRIKSWDFTFGYSLNAGIRAARGSLIAIASAHTLPVDENWLGNLVAPLRRDKVAMTYGRQVGHQASKLSELLDFERTFGPHPKDPLANGCFANNANSAVRRELWEQMPFDEALPGLEDIAWAKHWVEQGWSVVYEPSAALQHIHEETWPQVRRRFYREAVAAKHLGVSGRRRVPSECARELAWLCGDLAHAAKKEPSARRLTEICRFRYHKLRGTVHGLWDAKAVRELAEKKRAYYFESRCRAVQIKGPHRAELVELELPSLRPGEARIRVAYEGVCGTDLEMLSGELGYYKHGTAKYPIVPGHEMSGEVVEVGDNVDQAWVGDWVVVECIQSCGRCPDCRQGNHANCAQRQELGVMGLNGGYSQYLITPARFLHRIPPELDLRTAVLVEPTAVAIRGITRLGASWRGATPGARVAVVGAGPIGNLCGQLLQQRGYAVTILDRDARRRELAGQCGLSASESLEGLRDFDAVVEATGSVQALRGILSHSKAGACLLLIGLPYSRVEVDFENIVAYEKTIVGSLGSDAANFAEALAALPELHTEPFFGQDYRLENFQQAWKDFQEHKNLKTVLAVNQE